MKNIIKKILKEEIEINDDLNVYSDKVLFPEKLDQANKTLEKVGVP